MGANSLSAKATKNTVLAADVNQFVTALDEDLVPRTSGVPTDGAGDLGTSSYKWANVVSTNLTGTLQTAAQPNITSLGTLTGLTIGASGATLALQDSDGAGKSSIFLGDNSDINSCRMVYDNSDNSWVLAVNAGYDTSTYAIVADSSNNVSIPNGDISDGNGLVDYSSTSTVTGWSAFTTKEILVKKLGKTIHVWYDLRGTSNSTVASFTLADALSSSLTISTTYSRAKDNGTWQVDGSHAVLSGSTVTVYSDADGNQFTNSGVKDCRGYICYDTD